MHLRPPLLQQQQQLRPGNWWQDRVLKQQRKCAQFDTIQDGGNVMRISYADGAAYPRYIVSYIYNSTTELCLGDVRG